MLGLLPFVEDLDLSVSSARATCATLSQTGFQIGILVVRIYNFLHQVLADLASRMSTAGPVQQMMGKMGAATKVVLIVMIITIFGRSLFW